MVCAPETSPFLCLHLEYDLSTVEAWEELMAADHAPAARKACDGMIPEQRVAARARRVERADIPTSQSQPFDKWYEEGASKDESDEGGVAVWLDFQYAAGGPPALCVRIVTDLRHLDGVSAVRLAFRTLDDLTHRPAEDDKDGEASGDGGAMPFMRSMFRGNSAFSVRPLQLLLNVVCVTLSILWDAALMPWRACWACLAGRELDSNTPEGWMWSYRGSSYEPGEIEIYSGQTGEYKGFQAAVDSWRQELGLHRGFFYLLNFSPHVSFGVVRKVSQLNDPATKLRKALTEPVPAAADYEQQKLTYLILQRSMMFNNYGRHQRTFLGRPTGFAWDWINYPGKMTAAFCISINGVFLCGMRGMADNLDVGSRVLAGAGSGFGPGRRMVQTGRHPSQASLGKTMLPKTPPAPPAVPPMGEEAV